MAFTFKDVVRRLNRQGDIHAEFVIARMDKANVSPRYYAWTNESDTWLIMRKTTTNGVKVFDFVSGVTAFTTNWGNRASLTYVDFGGDVLTE